MSDTSRPSVAYLIGKYLDGSITHAETALLIESIESDDETRKRFVSSSLAHLFLEELTSPPERNSVPDYMNAYLNDFSDTFSKSQEPQQKTREVITAPSELSLFVSNEPFDAVSNVPIFVGTETTVSRTSFFSRWFCFMKKERPPVTLEEINARQKRSRIPFIITIVCFFLLIFSMVYQNFHHTHEWDEFVASARIEETIDAEWSSEEVAWNRGGEIDSGKLSLERGTVKLRFINGAEIILEGPCEYIINNTLSTFCNRGKVSAHIPKEAVGFEVLSPFGKVVDRGTDFFLEVDKTDAKIGVVKGHVDYFDETGTTKPLTTGMGIAIDTFHSVRDIPLDKISFVDKTAFLDKLVTYVQRREKNRQKIDLLWDSDPSLLLRFHFDQCDGKIIYNTATAGKALLEKAVILSGTKEEGSLYGHQAIGFGSRRSEVPLDINGKYESLTLWARIRVDSLPNHGNSLFSSGDDSQDTSAFLWQITKSGEFQIQINNRDLTSRGCYSTKRVLARKQRGTWVDVAVVLNGRDRLITHYMNGKPVTIANWLNPVPLAIDKARLANTKRSDASSNDRFFSGAFEDFRIFKKPLTSKQVASLTEEQ